MKKIFFILCLLACVLSVSAQKKVHDKDKENIIKSMEAGYWNFSPNWYMYWMHKDYSGASAKWEFHGFKSGWRTHFKEDKSNVKTIMPRRAEALIQQKAKKQIVEKEREQIEKLEEEEVARAADRNVDLVYGKYSDYFDDLQSTISASLTYCMKVSKGKMSKEINELVQQNDLITNNIAYLRKTGIGYELENQKRDQGFRDCKKDMEKLSKQAYALARVAKAYYD